MRRRVRNSKPSPTPSKPPSPLEAAVVRALDQELAWYFSYAETAARHQNVAFLPSHAATIAAEEHATEEDILFRSAKLASEVGLTLRMMPEPHASVLRAAYTPRRWPTAVVRDFGCLAAIVVRMAVAAHPWPVRSGHDGLEHAAAMHLTRLLMTDSARPAALRTKANRLMGKAITAYALARAKGRDATDATKKATA
jgi:hypothetical protein